MLTCHPLHTYGFIGCLWVVLSVSSGWLCKYPQGSSLGCSSLDSSWNRGIRRSHRLSLFPSFALPFDKLRSLNCSLCSHPGISVGQSLLLLIKSGALVSSEFYFWDPAVPSTGLFFRLSVHRIRLWFPLNCWELRTLSFRTHSEALLNGFSSSCWPPCDGRSQMPSPLGSRTFASIASFPWEVRTKTKRELSFISSSSSA